MKTLSTHSSREYLTPLGTTRRKSISCRSIRTFTYIETVIGGGGNGDQRSRPKSQYCKHRNEAIFNYCVLRGKGERWLTMMENAGGLGKAWVKR